MSQFIEMFGTLDEPKVNVSKLIDVVVSSGQYGSNTSATDYQEGKPRYIRITDINDDGSLNDDIKTAEVIDDKYRLESGDIVFARTGATVGKTYLHEAGDAIYAGYLIKYQMDSELMKPLFMKAFTHSKTYYNWVANSQKVGAQPNISATQYDQMPILVPSVDEQEAFLKIYQQADKSKFADFKSQFIEMFGTLDEPKVNVSKLIDVVVSSGQYGSNTSATDYQEGKPRYIRITDINDDGSLNDDIKTAEVIDDKYRLESGDIVFARTGATVGKTYLHEAGDAIYAGYLIKYQMDSELMKPLFMKAFTHSKTYYNWVANSQKVGAQPNISATQYDQMPILVPSVDEQEAFLKIYQQADKSKSHVLKALKETEILLQHSIRQVV